mmetsp:Transcript_68195/g.162793  ORF Transcript_68195/g.162793 Transcript_68195/m.162793 type:complete len:272 (+) Transcript_68195:3355-4170(+)
MLGNHARHHLAVLRDSVHLNLLGVLDELGDDDGMLFADAHGRPQEVLQVLVVVAHVHRRAGEHVRRADEARVRHLGAEGLGRGHVGDLAPLRLVDPELVKHARELVAVLGVVDHLRRGPEHAHVLAVQRHRDVVRRLPADGEHDAHGVLALVYVHHHLEGDLLEVKHLALVVVRRDRLRVAVEHDGLVPELAQLADAPHAAPVELDRRPDAVHAGSEHEHRAARRLQIAARRGVGGVEVVGHCGELPGDGVDLLHVRDDPVLLAEVADVEL